MKAPAPWNEVDRELQRQLSARLVGDDFSALPGMSAFGALVRTARLNEIEREHYASGYGLRLLRTDDVSEVLTVSRAQKNRLAFALGVRGTMRNQWDFESWLPFTGEFDHTNAPLHLKLCPCCARIGFHSLVFQLPWVIQCAWHGCRLITHCGCCRRPLRESLMKGLPLQCPCGHDYFVWPEACEWHVAHWRRAPSCLAAYHDWASEQRSEQHLVSPDLPHAVSWDVMASLVSLPIELRDAWGTASTTRTVAQRRVVFREVRADDRAAQIMAHEMPVTTAGAVDLPASFIKACQAVTLEVAGKLHASALTLSEWNCFLPPRLKRANMVNTAERPSRADVLFLPVLIAGRRAILDVSCISKIVRDVIHRTAAAIAPSEDSAAWMPTTPPCDVASLAVLSNVLRLLLLRAYAEGLRVVLSRHIPMALSRGRDRPRLTAPHVLLQRDLVGVRSATVAWTSAPPNDAVSRRRRTRSRRSPTCRR